MNSSNDTFGQPLLSYSETSIADQGRLSNVDQPIYCEYKQDLSGLQFVEQSSKLLRAHPSRATNLSKFPFQNGLAGNRQWLASVTRKNPKRVHVHLFNNHIDLP